MKIRSLNSTSFLFLESNSNKQPIIEGMMKDWHSIIWLKSGTGTSELTIDQKTYPVKINSFVVIEKDTFYRLYLKGDIDFIVIHFSDAFLTKRPHLLFSQYTEKIDISIESEPNFFYHAYQMMQLEYDRIKTNLESQQIIEQLLQIIIEKISELKKQQQPLPHIEKGKAHYDLFENFLDLVEKNYTSEHLNNFYLNLLNVH